MRSEGCRRQPSEQEEKVRQTLLPTCLLDGGAYVCTVRLTRVTPTPIY